MYTRRRVRSVTFPTASTTVARFLEDRRGRTDADTFVMGSVRARLRVDMGLIILPLNQL